MCLAIPMKVLELETPEGGEGLLPPVAVVDADGIRRRVRLDVVDRVPEVGEFVIVHAGFAIHTLAPGEAEANLELLRQMARAVAGEG
ncbi:HypC/HybG/HupF family hydrogenase formation chaperone [Dissulfurirhabdus thermomarina]|uniref:HypC/HybG/HupF family hydrogenase formation chaperone n=1 Tax=Dissulfurirhabdus thermomarina TaxID=1765737 RepID=A0A6N9TMT8_DISTH|nr:HypC/HybG/HupF family hydrogenase formation chaperone [Dissulfurirhabdus thermomarina]NDY42601.1 HypC/HybG/HupF family hydrogenase formation chaperone [Dissulfurirhabdus thermomarina]NMX22654.1 HypC/HybG/HupF family hydrogenase formation chaperone [Dissulfurirhabdus thermomarina]